MYSHSSINIEKILEFYKKNKDKVIAGAVIFMFLVLIIIYSLISRATNIRIANERLGAAMASYSNNQFEDALTQLNEVLKFKGTIPYEYAVLFKSDIAIRKGNFDEAINTLQKLKATKKSTKSLKMFLLAKAYDFKNELEKATEYYENFIKQYPEHHLNAEATYSLAKIYIRKGDIDKARENFEKVITLYPRSIWEAMARKFLGK
ncbi:MAG: tetratricopeptide repeat protein [bacterium]|nr:tetratricopeptide repeat protein [bacterium]